MVDNEYIGWLKEYNWGRGGLIVLGGAAVYFYWWMVLVIIAFFQIKRLGTTSCNRRLGYYGPADSRTNTHGLYG